MTSSWRRRLGIYLAALTMAFAVSAGGGGDQASRPRVILHFPNDPNDMLLSDGLVGQQALVGRALIVDAPLGKGHVVMFANRPFWRYESPGSFNLAFNAILNWNHLDAGAARPAEGTRVPQ
jgi:hypothetical protein